MISYATDRFRILRNDSHSICFLWFQVITQSLINNSTGNFSVKCSLGKLLMLLLISGVTCLFLMNKSSPTFESKLVLNSTFSEFTEAESTEAVYQRPPRLWRRPPRLPPRLTPDEMNKKGSSLDHSKWVSRQQKVKEAFIHAWSGYKNFAMGFDELMPVSKRGTDGLGGLGATVIDALDTAMIMGENGIVREASSWIEENLVSRINEKGQVNLFETTIRVLGGLLSAYHLSTVGNNSTNAEMLLEVSKVLADRLLLAFSSSSTPIPFSDVYLRDKIARPAPDGLSSTSEVSTLQLEFNYLSEILGDHKYYSAGMKVLEHMRSLPKVEGLVPIYIRYTNNYLF